MEPEFELSGEILLDKPIKCFGETNGALNALVFGGNGSYSYSWNTNFDMQVISGIGQGLYSVSVVDEKGCEIELDYDLVQPDLLQGSVD